MLVGAGGLLGTAAWLEPDASGLGTHAQLGLPACGWIHAAGVPCPTCGMTTAFALAADGRLLAALACQPAGAVLALLTAAAGLLGAMVLFTGASLGPYARRFRSSSLWWGLGALILGGWLWKIAAFRSGL